MKFSNRYRASSILNSILLLSICLVFQAGCSETSKDETDSGKFKVLEASWDKENVATVTLPETLPEGTYWMPVICWGYSDVVFAPDDKLHNAHIPFCDEIKLGKLTTAYDGMEMLWDGETSITRINVPYIFFPFVSVKKPERGGCLEFVPVLLASHEQGETYELQSVFHEIFRGIDESEYDLKSEPEFDHSKLKPQFVYLMQFSPQTVWKGSTIVSTAPLVVDIIDRPDDPNRPKISLKIVPGKDE